MTTSHPSLSKTFKTHILQRDNYRCRLCGCAVGEVCNAHYAPVSQLDVAQVIPWPLGPLSPDNMRATCHPCNARERQGNALKPIFEPYSHTTACQPPLPQS